MSIEVIKSELSKLDNAELLEVIQFGLDMIKERDQEDFETPDWLKAEIQKRAQEMKSGQATTYTWEEVQNFAKASNG